MHAFVAGLVIGVGFSILVNAAFAHWFSKHGIYSIGYAVKKSKAERDTADARGREAARRYAARSRRAIFPGAAFIVLGAILVATWR